MANITPKTREELVQSFIDTAIANSNITSISNTSALIGLAQAVASIVSNFYNDLTLAFPSTILQGLYDLFNFSSMSATSSTVTITLTGTSGSPIPIGAQFSTSGTPSNPAIVFQTTQSATISSSGTTTIQAISTTTGINTNVVANSITNIITPIIGVSSITNLSPSYGGTNAENATNQLNRFNQYLDSISTGTVASITYNLSQISGVDKLSTVTPPYYYGFQDANGTFSDYSRSLNSPKGISFAPFITSPSVGDAFYIGADRQFTKSYLDVETVGSGLYATWQYWDNNTSGWSSLTLTDNTLNGQVNGSLYWTAPSGWGTTVVNNVRAFWLRLSLTSGSYVTMPTWFQFMPADPIPPIVDIYVYPTASSSGSVVLQNVLNEAPNYLATYYTPNVKQPNVVVTDIALSVTPTSFGQSVDITTPIQNNITNLFNNLNIGQSITLAQISYAAFSIFEGTAIASVDVTSPQYSVYVGVDTLLTIGTITVTITPGVD